MNKKGDNQETIIQNKIAIIAFHVATYLGLVAFIESVDVLDLNKITRLLIYLFAGYPVLFYVVYLLFLPLRYNKKEPYKLWITGYSLFISEEKLNRLFDHTASAYPTMIILLPSYLITSILFEKIGVFKDANTLTWILYVLLLAVIRYLICWLFGLVLGRKHK